MRAERLVFHGHDSSSMAKPIRVRRTRLNPRRHGQKSNREFGFRPVFARVQARRVPAVSLCQFLPRRHSSQAGTGANPGEEPGSCYGGQVSSPSLNHLPTAGEDERGPGPTTTCSYRSCASAFCELTSSYAWRSYRRYRSMKSSAVTSCTPLNMSRDRLRLLSSSAARRCSNDSKPFPAMVGQ